MSETPTIVRAGDQIVLLSPFAELAGGATGTVLAIFRRPAVSYVVCFEGRCVIEVPEHLLRLDAPVL